MTGFHGYGFFQPTTAAQGNLIGFRISKVRDGKLEVESILVGPPGAGVLTQDRGQPGGSTYYDFTANAAQGHVARFEL